MTVTDVDGAGQSMMVTNHYIMPVAFFKVGPPGCFIRVSTTTPVVSALKNYHV